MRYYLLAEVEVEDGVLKLADTEAQYLVAKRGLGSVADIPRTQTRPNHLNKYNFRINVNASPKSNVDVAVSSGYIVNNIRLPQTGDNFSSMIGAALNSTANPNLVAQTGGYGGSRPGDFIGEESYRKQDHFINSGTASWRPLSWLTARATLGIDYLSYADEQNVRAGQGCPNCGTENQGKRMYDKYADVKYTADVNSSAQYRIAKQLTGKTSIGAQYNHDKLFQVRAQADILPPGIISLSAGAQKTLGEQTADVITLGTYLEQQFGLNDRLFVIGAIRIDDNSAFGAAARSAYYPKVSGSWVARESRNAGFLTSLRFRGAYGVTGQSPRPLDALTFETPITASLFGVPATPGVTLGGFGDPTLKPERSREIEAGFDAGFLNNRLSVEATVYDKRTKDALVVRPQSPSLGGIASRLENIGVVSNKGLEVSLNSRVIEGRSLTWDLQLEGALNRNRLISLTGVPQIVGFSYKNIPGYPLFGLWWQNLTSFRDANNDGAISPTEVVVTDTLVYLGSTIPTRTLSANTAVGLFRDRLRVAAQLDYRGGYMTLNVNDLSQCSLVGNCQAIHDPSASLEDQARGIAGARAFGAYAQSAEHLRLREASITYAPPTSWARALRARAMTITLTGRNLWIRTFGFTSWDPENVTFSTDANNINESQPKQPTYVILRVNLAF